MAPHHRAQVSKVSRTGSSSSSQQKQERQPSGGIITSIDPAAERSCGISQALEGPTVNGLAILFDVHLIKMSSPSKGQGEERKLLFFSHLV